MTESNDDLRALRAAATPGPWIVNAGEIVTDDHSIQIAVDLESDSDARLIVAVVNNLLPLLDRLEAAEARVRELEAALGSVLVDMMYDLHETDWQGIERLLRRGPNDE